MRRFMVRMYTPSAAATCDSSGVGGHIQSTPIPTQTCINLIRGGSTVCVAKGGGGGGLGGLWGQEPPHPPITPTPLLGHCVHACEWPHFSTPPPFSEILYPPLVSDSYISVSVALQCIRPIC